MNQKARELAKKVFDLQLEISHLIDYCITYEKARIAKEDNNKLQ